jgi:type IV pilus assembly protein PilV
MRKQHGLGMIEVLVAALIMAIGILGYAAMQVRTLQEATNAQYRMQALALAGDLVARARANRQDGSAGWLSAYVLDQYAGNVQQASCLNAACTSAALAAADVYAINQQLGRLLPGGDISVSQNAANPQTYLVRVAWNGHAPTAEQCDDPSLDEQNNFESHCVTLEVGS